MENILNVILGTAGHIDHGKTTLVRALTGINCDRLEEERRRGITIELGFAWLDLPNGQRLGIVDVPGHERFIKNMVAGASGMDCVLFVVAADEGVMPQTREHLEICELLGLRSGIVALTKTDMVDAEWLEAIKAEVKNAFAGSFLADAPIVPVSALTGEGLEELGAEISRHVASLRQCPKSDIFRLPVDRVFSLKGFGTVVTGTIASGSCAQGDKLCIVPSGKISKARNIQVHNTEVALAREGQRCAVNLQGIEVGELERGDTLAKPGALFPETRWITRLNCLKSSPLPIRQRSEVHFHHGTRECLAKIILLEGDELNPGQSAIAEVKFARPMAAIYGDHIVIRSFSPLRTIGGGQVISPMPPALRKRQPDFQQKMELLRELGGMAKNKPELNAENNPEIRTRICLELCSAPGADMNQLLALTGLSHERLRACLAGLEEKGEIFRWDREAWVDQKSLRFCLKQCQIRAKELHDREPLKGSFPPGDLISGWGDSLPQKFTQEVLYLAVKKGILCQEGSGLKLAEHKTELDKASLKILKLLQKKIKSGGMAPPFIREIIEDTGWDLKKLQPLLNYLCDSNKLLKIQDGVYYDREEFAKIEELIRKWFETHQELDVGDIKTILGVSRKYAIPILEYLDAIRMTCRVNNKRRLRGRQGE